MPTYKDGHGSDGAPEEVRAAVNEARRGLDMVLPLLGAETYLAPGWEADDLCATLAKRHASAGEKVLVASGDKDLLQLVRKGVHLVRPARKRGDKPVVVHAANWEETSGVPPLPTIRDAWLTVQSLWGDPGDGVPGIRGIGEVRAKQVVRAFPDALRRLGRPGAFSGLSPALRTLLESAEALSAAALSYELVRLRDDLRGEPTPGPGPDAAAAEELLYDYDWDGASAAGKLSALSCDPDSGRRRRSPR